MQIKVKKGYHLNLGNAPASGVPDPVPAQCVALLGRDYPGIRLKSLVEVNDEVIKGQPVLCDRHRPEMVIVSPICGTVSHIHRGPRRAIVALQIERSDDDTEKKFDVTSVTTAAELAALMMSSGIWTGLHSRRFNQVAYPAVVPRAIMVTAMDTEPLAARPEGVIAENADSFHIGLVALTRLVQAPVYVCYDADAQLNVRPHDRVQSVSFSGPHPAGLVGTHMHFLCPVTCVSQPVWHIGYQDVISLGVLHETGAAWHERTVSIAGSGVRHPKLINASLGACVQSLLHDELSTASAKIISGSALSGDVASGAQAFLGRYHTQITALSTSTLPNVVAEPSNAVNGSRVSAANANTLSNRPSLTPNDALTADPLLPSEQLDRVAPPGIVPAPLLRALLTGDVDRASELGCLTLAEEDLGLLSYFSSARVNYGPLLRNVLDQLQ